MALSATRLSASMRANILGAACGAIDGPALTALCDALAGAVIAEIIAHAVVPATGLVAPPGAVGGPVTGQAVVT